MATLMAPTPGPGIGQPDRADAMGRRLDRTARRLGIDTDGRDLIRRAFGAAMEPRRARIEDDHHPDFLHPARSALILMDDARESDAALLATAILAETRDPTLAPPAGAVERISSTVADGLARIPRPGPGPEDRMLLERLLALSPGLARVAAAERLDHARHLHVRDRGEWASYHATTCGVYVPVAGRVHERLGARLDWWCATFRRRFLER